MVVAFTMATEFPLIRWVLLFGLVGGAMLAGGLIFFRRRTGISRSSGDRPGPLFGEAPAPANTSRRTTVEVSPTEIELGIAMAG